MKFLKRLLTKNMTKIPILVVYFDHNYYMKHGNKGSCNADSHPLFKDDEKLKQMFRDMINYIRDNYNMEEI